MHVLILIEVRSIKFSVIIIHLNYYFAIKNTIENYINVLHFSRR